MPGTGLILGGLPIHVEALAPVRWRLPPAAPAQAELRMQVTEVGALPPAQGTRLYRGPRFSVWQDGGRLALHLGDPLGRPRIVAGFQPSAAEVEIAALAPRDADDLQLRDEVLPELLVTHLWPIRGRAYLHAAGILSRRGVQLFLGPSGQGKSTAAGQLVAAGHQLFTADRCAAWVDETPRAAGVPWHGGQAGSGRAARLEALFVLERHRQPGVRRLTGARALAALTANAFLPRWWPEGLAAALQALHRLAAATPVFALSSEPDARLVGRVERALETAHD